MSNFCKKFFVLALVSAVALSVCGVSYAAEGENSLTGFFRKLFNYPVKATEKTGEMTANTLNNTGETLSHAGENTAEVLKGDIAQTGDLAGEVVKDTAETTGQTAAETVQMPVAAAEANQ